MQSKEHRSSWALIRMHQIISQGVAYKDHLFFEVTSVLSEGSFGATLGETLEQLIQLLKVLDFDRWFFAVISSTQLHLCLLDNLPIDLK